MKNLHTLACPCKQALKLRIISSRSWLTLWSCTWATMVFSSLTGNFFDRCHHLIHGFVGERTTCVPCEVFSELFLAAFEQLYDHVFAFEFCCFGVISEEVRPFFTRPSRRYGWSPHFFILSCCYCVAGWLAVCVCAIRMDCDECSDKFIFHVSCFVLAFRVKASVVWHGVFFLQQPFFVVGSCRGAKTTGKQRWRSRHIVRYRCSLRGFQQREILSVFFFS